nr:MAG TPA: protein-turn-helix DNA binding protein [Caudoviricetes sp.]
MAKLTKQTVAAVSKGKKEVAAKPKTSPKTASKVTAKPAATKAPVKPKVTKAATKAVAKTPVKTPRKTTAKTPVKAPVKTEVKAEPVEVPKIPAKAVLMPRTKKVENKPRKPRTFRTDTSKFRKYNNELRINLRNLIHDKGFTIAKVAREMGILPHYLFNVLKLNKTSEGGNGAVVVLDIAYAVCSVIGANISSVLPEAEIVNPIYKTKTDVTDKVNELQEENVKLNFLFTQTKQQLDTQFVKLATAEARVKELENFLESSFNKIGKIRERLANISKLEESKS